jgi:hypothetical protein
LLICFSENEVDWIELLENPVEENIDDHLKEIKPLPPWPLFIHQIQAKVDMFNTLLMI